MAPSVSLQSRIQAFENFQSSVQSNNTEYRKSNGLRGHLRVPRLSLPPSPQTDCHILDSDPTSPTADALISIPPIQPSSSSRPSSPPALGRKSSLIHFNELPSPQLKPTSPIVSNGTGSTSGSSSSVSDLSRKPPLPPRSTSIKSPPIPPRKPSLLSLKTSHDKSTLPPFAKRHASSPVTLSPSQASSSSGTLLGLPDSHTYPPASVSRSRHIPTASTSSFHSVSLSSDGGETHEGSLDGSYEAVSSTVATSPVSSQHSWENDLRSTPKPSPQTSKSQDASPSPTAQDLVIPGVPRLTPRRPAPPPPQRRTTVKPSKSPPDNVIESLCQRPVLLPANVRQRYDVLFDRNLAQFNRRKGEHSSGWRGLSVDLLTSTPGTSSFDLGESIAGEERLPGSVVKLIWSCSKLPKAQLREIWNECDKDRLGSLNREEFAQGTWRIDEILSVAQQMRQKKKHPPSLRPPAARPPTYVL